MTNPTIARIRHEISRIPAGVGRDAESFKQDLNRTLDALEVEDDLVSLDETPMFTPEPKPLQLREGGYFATADGTVHGPMSYEDVSNGYPWSAGSMTWTKDGDHCHSDGCPNQLIAEVPAPVAETAAAQPKPLQLREGGWYRRRDGEIVGPILFRPDEGEYCFRIESRQDVYLYRSDGQRIYGKNPNTWLVAEVPAPVADTTCTPLVPVEIDKGLHVCNQAGYATPLFLAIVRGLQAQITALREERR